MLYVNILKLFMLIGFFFVLLLYYVVQSLEITPIKYHILFITLCQTVFIFLFVLYRMRVTASGGFLHNVYPSQFLDSLEWLVRVTISLNTVHRAVILELHIFEEKIMNIILIVATNYPNDVRSIVIPHIFEKIL